MWIITIIPEDDGQNSDLISSWKGSVPRQIEGKCQQVDTGWWSLFI